MSAGGVEGGDGGAGVPPPPATLQQDAQEEQDFYHAREVAARRQHAKELHHGSGPEAPGSHATHQGGPSSPRGLPAHVDQQPDLTEAARRAGEQGEVEKTSGQARRVRPLGGQTNKLVASTHPTSLPEDVTG
ncbi:hypothetical protein ABPG75_000686 [Micractinium tetrahymenae]